MAQELIYYRHSARISPGSTLAAMGLMGVFAIVFAAGYSVFILFCHLIYVNAVAAFVIGFIFALFSQAMLRKFAVRNRAIGWGLVAVTGAFVLWSAWLTWIYVFLWIHHHGPAIPLWWLASRPDKLWRIIVAINEVGAWSLNMGAHGVGDAQPQDVRGFSLWIIWLIEAAALVGPLIFIAGRNMLEMPYCEGCRAWCRQVAFAALQPTDGEMLKRKMEFQEFAYLQTIGKAGHGAYKWTRLTVQACPKCSSLRTLCVESIREVAKDNGRRKSVATPIVEWLMLTDMAAKQISAFADRIENEEAGATNEPAISPTA